MRAMMSAESRTSSASVVAICRTRSRISSWSGLPSIGPRVAWRGLLNAPLASTDLADIQQSFADAYPRIQGLASAQHCRLKGEEKEEAVAETIAISWSEYRKLALAGLDVVHVARTFPLDQAPGAHRAL